MQLMIFVGKSAKILLPQRLDRSFFRSAKIAYDYINLNFIYRIFGHLLICYVMQI